jgi:glutamate/tyrosine decarboxylase-like PLP-dependent enzyme
VLPNQALQATPGSEPDSFVLAWSNRPVVRVGCPAPIARRERSISMSQRKCSSTIGQDLTPTYAARELSNSLPKNRMADQGMAPRTACQIIHDELRLDGYSLLNLATFVRTWMEPEARQLIGETLDKNTSPTHITNGIDELLARTVRTGVAG